MRRVLVDQVFIGRLVTERKKKPHTQFGSASFHLGQDQSLRGRLQHRSLLLTVVAVSDVAQLDG